MYGLGSPPETLAPALRALAAIVPERLSTAKSLCAQHANSLTFLPPEPPWAVVWPETTAEVQAIVAVARDHRLPLIPFGAGTSLEGHVNAPQGGISVDLSRLNRIVEIRPDDLDCTVEAGITLDVLRAGLRHTGLFFPVDPGAGQATLGGMAATRASGTTTVRYGSMRDNVVSLTVVLASGEIIRTARRARKSAAGYDLTHLFVGSEGTLGIITELTLRLHGVPAAIVAASASFASIAGACRTATAAIQAGLAVARIELLDPVQIACVNAKSGLAIPEAPTLFVEFHGTAAACQEDYASFCALAAEEGGSGLRFAASEADRRALWKARHNAFWSVKEMWPGRDVVVTDVAVPLSKLAEAVGDTAADIRASRLNAPIVGHVGDGNFHAIVVVDRNDSAEIRRVDAFLDRLVARALALDGTATGEHGIGQGKRRHMAAEHAGAVAAMRAVKAALDPLGIMNPEKIF